MDKEKPNWSWLLNVNVGFLGVQIGNGLQVANISTIFESLGAQASQLPILWLGAPLIGLVAQPIIGMASDRTWSRWGRRQPYFLLGALLAGIMLITLPQTTHLWQAVTMYWILQLGLNISVTPAKPFIGDLLPPGTRTLGYAIQGFCVGLGAIFAAALPWLLETLFSLETSSRQGVPIAITDAYTLGAVLLVISTLWTFWSIQEDPPEPVGSDDPEAAASPLGMMGRAIAAMPPTMKRLAIVQFLTWSGVYLIFLYLPTAIAINILGATDKQSPSYAYGVEWAGICTAFYNLVCLGISLLIPRLSRWWGRSNLHIISLLCGSAGLISLLLVHSRYPILLSMVGVGIAWASILSIPYALLMDELSESQSGLYMGLFNVSVTLPQIVLSLGFGWFMKTYLQENRLWALALGSLFFAIAAISMVWVPETTTVRPKTTDMSSDQEILTAQE